MPARSPPPPPVSNEQFCPQKIRSERECSLDAPFGARYNIAKRRQHIPWHKTPSPFKAQSDGGLQLALRSKQLLFNPAVYLSLPY